MHNIEFHCMEIIKFNYVIDVKLLCGIFGKLHFFAYCISMIMLIVCDCGSDLLSRLRSGLMAKNFQFQYVNYSCASDQCLI